MTPFEAAVEYHNICELFDRSVCTGGMGRDGVLPANNRELIIIENHALNILSQQAKSCYMPISEFKKIISSYPVLEEARKQMVTLYNKAPQPSTKGEV